MRWFENEKYSLLGSDDECPGKNPQNIAEIANTALGDDAMLRFMRDFFGSQKGFGEFIGVGESTVAGWVKNKSFPDYAKRAALAAYYARKYFNELRKTQRENERPKVVKDGESYLIVLLKTDEVGVSVGEILARGIPTEKSALKLAGSSRAWELLEQAENFIDTEIEILEPEESERLRYLKDEIRLERHRVFAHEKLLERKLELIDLEVEEAKLLAEQLDLEVDEAKLAARNANEEENK